MEGHCIGHVLGHMARKEQDFLGQRRQCGLFMGENYGLACFMVI